VVVLLLGISYLFFPADVPAPDWESTALTTSVGLAYAPSLSPDGSAIVYGHDAAGAMDIYSKNVVGGVPNQLTSTPFGDVIPRYSPRGNNVAFVSDRGFGALVYWIPSLGGVAKPLVNSNISAVERVNDSLGVLGGMPWSPDETELLFSRQLPTGQFAIFRTDMSGQVTQITFPEPGTDDLCASWSFDGRRIVFERRSRSARSGLWSLPASGGTPQELLVDDFDNSQPAWSEDDRRVIYSSNRAKSWNIWEIDVATRKVCPLTFGPGDHHCPTVSRNGRIAYAQFRHQTDLYLKSVEGNAEPRRLTQWMGDNFAARISPQRNRREVVYQSSRSGDLEIWHRDLESGEEANLSHHAGLDVYPDWSPGADRIVFVSDRDGALRPWIMNRDGSLPRRFSDKVISLPDLIHCGTRSPRWSADGEAIAYVALGDGRDALWVFDSVGKQEPQQYLSGVLGFEWYGQGHRYVIYRRRADDGEGPMQMYAADLESGAEKLLLEALHCELIVAPDGSAVAYCDVVAHQTMNIYLLKLKPPETPGELPTAIGEPMPLVTGGQGRWHTHIGGWSPDSKEIIYTHDEDFGQIWLLSRRQQ
jgi:Tol biopolymer transport system component